MPEQVKSDSKHASIHEIISENKRRLLKQQISQLFCTPDLCEMDLNELTHHPYMQLSDSFSFFVYQLEKWNRKIRNKQLKPFYQAELHRNMFLLSSLKIICLKKPNEIHRYLEELALWYNKNSYNTPQTIVLAKKQNPNQEWEVRKTFKSNSPSEIHNYRRRFLCSPDDKDTPFAENFLQLHKKKENNFFESKPYQPKIFLHSRTSADEYDSKSIEPFKQVMKNKDIKLAKLQHIEIRQKRQQQQVNRIQDSWKSSHSRFAQKTCKNFFKGRFTKNKEFIQMAPVSQMRKIKTAAFNKRRMQQTQLVQGLKKGRIMTSLGIRKNIKNEQQNTQSQGRNMMVKTESNEQTGQQTTTANWIQKFTTDEDMIDIRNTWNGGSNMTLISNPFEAGKNKIKKKKR